MLDLAPLYEFCDEIEKVGHSLDRPGTAKRTIRGLIAATRAVRASLGAEVISRDDEV